MTPVNDIAGLRLELDALDTESRRRPAGAPRGDLIVRARALQRQAAQLGMPEFIAVSLMREASIQGAEGRYEESIAPLERARASLGQLRRDDLGVRALALLAEAHGNTGDWEALEEVCREGIAIVEQYRDNVSAPYLQSAYLRSRVGLYRWGVRAAYQRGDTTAMLDRAELSKSRFAVRHASLTPEDDPDADAALRRVQDEIDVAQRGGRTVGGSVLAKRRALWDQRMTRRLRANGVVGEAFDIRSIQRLLGSDEAVIYYYWTSPDHLLIVTIDSERVVPELRAIEPTDGDALRGFADRVLAFVPGRPMNFLDKAKGFSALLLPHATEATQALRKHDRLIVSPHRSLHAIPFQALSWDGRALIQSFALRYAANLATIGMTYERRAVGPVIVVGTSHYEQGFPDLPQAEEEAEIVRDWYEETGVEVVPLIGPSAVEAKLKDVEARGGLRQCRALHFATHGFNISTDNPMESRIALRDGFVDGIEISNWRLGAEVVVLSACCSGQRAISGRGMDELPGDELFGLQAAFFMAGARRVLGALWPVDSEAAKKITTAFHRHLHGGLEPDVALQRATTEFIDAAEPLDARTYFWGPFFMAAIGHAGGEGG